MAELQAPSPPSLEALRIDRRMPPRRRRRRRWLWALGLFLLAAVAVAVLLARRPPTVRVAEVRQARPGEQLTELSAAGYVDARRRSVIAPQVPGRLVEVAVDEGDAVKAGDMLARLDDRDAQVGLSRARAELNAALQRLASVRATARNNRGDLRRAERLAQAQVITPQDLDRARTTARSTRAEERAAAAQVVVARRAVEAASLQRAHTVVRAPFSGTVVRKLADEGAVLAPATITQENVGGIVELVDLGTLEVEAEVSEEQLARVRSRQPTLIFLDAFPDQAFPGTVRTVRPAIDRSKATADVKVEFQKIPPGTLPDMGARVAFLSEELPPEALARSSTTLRVPATAVQRQEGQSFVWTVQDGRLRRLPVQVSERTGDEVTLTEGPPPGTPVVVSPDARLRPGRRVQVQTEGG